MLLHWYACISTNTCCFEMYYISLETNWWALPNAILIVWIRSAVHVILADKAFTATDGLISQSFVVTFIPLAYVQIALIWGFPAQLSLWKLVHWLWRYKLNEVCDKNSIRNSLQNSLSYILLQMVCANYCALYPKWPCIKHEANMWSLYCIISSCSRTFYNFLSSSVINVVTTPSNVTDVINHL